MSNEKSTMNRRSFFTNAGAFAAGAAAAGGMTALGGGAARAATQPLPERPWPYVTLDTETVRKKGHLGYYQGKCAQGSFFAIVSELQEKVGDPYTMIPVHIMAYGSGGVSGWCTLCGAVNGACAAVSLISPNYKKINDELITWFTQTPLPTAESNTYAAQHQYLVEKYKTDKVLPQSVPGSPLCHVTVTRWCKENNYASGSKERSERCARMSGDVAAKAAELLNQDMAGGFKDAYAYSAEVQACRACHAKGKDVSTGGWTRGRMECYDCHSIDDAHMIKVSEHLGK